MKVLAAFAALGGLVSAVAATPWLATRTIKTRNNTPPPQGLVTTDGTSFMRNGKPFNYIGANAYWLAEFSDENINATVKNLAANNISVIRTYAFKDVTQIPQNGTWFQLLAPNGTKTVNTGINGLQRLQKVIDAAEANNIMVQFVLTNNWNPGNNNGSSTVITMPNGTTIVEPAGSLSNEYGGMDAYVHFNGLNTHDQFFSNQSLINQFQEYLDAVIPIFKDSGTLLAWEIANDPRCNSSLQASPDCTTTTITQWHSTIAQHIKTLDPNHLVSSGTQGFLCTLPSCQKLFQPTATAQPSPTAVASKRAVPVTFKQVINEQRDRFKRNAEVLSGRSTSLNKRQGNTGRWRFRPRPNAKRQSDQVVSSAHDGSQGVDSQDISFIPQIGFHTFQLLPDQNTYATPDPSLPVLNNTIQVGQAWIKQQVQTGNAANKPTTLTAFGLITSNNAPFFIPFNSTTVFQINNTNSSTPSLSARQTQGFTDAVGVEAGQAPLSDADQAQVYQAWLQEAIQDAIAGASVYQWGQSNLTVPTQQGITGAPQDSNTFTPALPNVQGITPNDGYATTSPDTQAVVQRAAIEMLLRNIQV